MSQVMVSVVIPCFNSEKWIKETLESVFNQSYRSIEVIVVDDGSTDKTKEIVCSFGETIKYIAQSNQGPSIARNVGIREANGKYIAFLDSDDLWESDKLYKQVQYLEENQNTALVFSNVTVVNQNGEYLYTHFNKVPENKKDLIKAFFLGKIGMNTPTILARKSAVNNVGGFEESLPVREDHYFLMSMAERYTIHHFQEPLVKRRINETSMTQSVKAEKLYTLNKPFITKSIESFPYLKHKLRTVNSNINMSIAKAHWRNNNYKLALKYINMSILQKPFSLKKYVILFLLFNKIDQKKFEKFKMKLRFRRQR